MGARKLTPDMKRRIAAALQMYPRPSIADLRRRFGVGQAIIIGVSREVRKWKRE